MLLYNVTYGIDKSIEQEWVAWMKEQYIPAVLESKLFGEGKIFKVLHDDEASISYSVQFFAATIDHVLRFMEHVEPELNNELNRRYKDRHVAFRTLLESV